MQPELIADYACVTGEGPLWHPAEQHLYWVVKFSIKWREFFSIIWRSVDDR